MYVNRHYQIQSTIKWSKKPLRNGFLYSAAVIVLYEFTGIPFSLPWQPISVIGIAVAFYLGFKNNSSYDRTWEARKIWGSIINYSRAFSSGVMALPEEKVSREVKVNLVKRHLAWTLALKHAMRKGKPWEHNGPIEKMIFTPTFQKEMRNGVLPEIEKYLQKEELEELITYGNLPTHLLKNQRIALQKLSEKNQIGEFTQVWFQELVTKLYDVQGMTERIKNFPFPRQYASTGMFINYIFCALIPFGLLDIFEQSTELHYWLTIPFSGIIIWIFFLVDRIGDYSENPFEGAYNDVPISSISRMIEIELLEMMGEKELPSPYPVENGFLM